MYTHIAYTYVYAWASLRVLVAVLRRWIDDPRK
jgi:hypothetical protein